MGSFSIDVDIDRSARDVFAVLCDVRRMPHWYEAVKEVVALTPAVSGLGARYEIGRTLPGGPVRNEVAGEGLPGPLAHIDTLVTQLFKRWATTSESWVR